MFARLSIHENVDLDLADQVKQWFEATETDAFRELPGSQSRGSGGIKNACSRSHARKF